MTRHAPGQYLGYSLQATRFLVRLLQAEHDWSVSLEAFEDVGVEAPDGSRIAEQTKSSLDGNPVSDRALDLWKTFSNWINAVQSGELIPEKTYFEIYVSGPKSGMIVDRFSNAQSRSEAVSALAYAKDELWGSAPAFPLKSLVSDFIRSYITAVFNADEDIVCQIIQNFQLQTGSGSPQEDLKGLFGRLLVPEEILDDTLKHAQGWVKETIDRLLESGKPACVMAQAFRNEVISYIRKRDSRNILRSFAHNPTSEEIDEDMRVRTYVRQLDIIEAEDGEKIRAVTDFLKACVDRTQWSEKGLVHASSFDDFEEGLWRHWDNCKRKANLTHRGLPEVVRGKYLFYECASHKATLEGLEVPHYFTPGSFHTLADGLVIGWHPDFANLLTTPRK